MKKVILSISLLLGFHYAFAQSYIVTYLKGNVYHNATPIKLHDRLDGVSELTSDDRNSEVALFSAQKGKFRLSFKNSKAVAASAAAKKSELFQLVVGNYLLAYTTEKTLTSRGEFDLKSFFSPVSGKDSDSVFLIEGESLPLKSSVTALHPDDNFSVCTISGKDTTCTAIKHTSSYLVFDGETGKIFMNGTGLPKTITCIIKRGYTLDGKYREENFSGPVSITFLPKDYMEFLVSSFAEGMNTYYKDDKSKLAADVEDELNYYYGRNFEPAVKQALKRYE